MERRAGAGDADTLIFIGDDTLVAKFGALATRPSAMLPRNWHRLDAGQVAISLDRFRIRFAYVVDRRRSVLGWSAQRVRCDGS